MDIKRLKARNIDYSKHGDQERQNEFLLITEIEDAILAGRILEEYEDTGRGESCLIVGFTQQGKPIHVICGSRGDRLVIITVYILKLDYHHNFAQITFSQ